MDHCDDRGDKGDQEITGEERTACETECAAAAAECASEPDDRTAECAPEPDDSAAERASGSDTAAAAVCAVESNGRAAEHAPEPDGSAAECASGSDGGTADAECRRGCHGGLSQPKQAENDILKRAAENVNENDVDELEQQMMAGAHELVNAIDIDSTSELMHEVEDLMIMGYQANLPFERDFIAEGVAMLNGYELDMGA